MESVLILVQKVFRSLQSGGFHSKYVGSATAAELLIKITTKPLTLLLTEREIQEYCLSVVWDKNSVKEKAMFIGPTHSTYKLMELQTPPVKRNE